MEIFEKETGAYCILKGLSGLTPVQFVNCFVVGATAFHPERWKEETACIAPNKLSRLIEENHYGNIVELAEEANNVPEGEYETQKLSIRWCGEEYSIEYGRGDSSVKLLYTLTGLFWGRSIVVYHHKRRGEEILEATRVSEMFKYLKLLNYRFLKVFVWEGVCLPRIK